ncbi:MarR family winged helix-turn-helix transcriptional regulator [Pediococcus acidilactici]|uniref:MarR family winged helix-turn-helix transcriptional regulator n=1 Tax=Pediococcus acidilactici TaxID=1254 RepID=UPI001898B9B4|nr:MarR family winged helix-turn-helix transcriptional regulator [Pediococcus acidilactici]
MDKRSQQKVRKFNWFYTTQLNLMNNHHLGSTTTLLEGRIMLEVSFGYNTLKQLVRILNLDKGYVSRTVKRLVDRGWLKQRRNQQDQRIQLLELTSLGQKIVREVDVYSNQQVTNILGDLSKTELALVIKDMEEIQEVIERYHRIDFGK